MESTAAVRPDDVPIENTPTAKPRETLAGSISGGKKTKPVVSSHTSLSYGGRLKDSSNSADKNEKQENGGDTNGVKSADTRKESVTRLGSHTGSRGKDSVTSTGRQTGRRGKDSITGTGSGHSTDKDSVSSSVSVQAGGRMKESVSSTSSLSGGKKTTKSKSKPLYFWNNADVNKGLKKHAPHLYHMYGDMLVQQDVTGRTLIRMNDIKLERIGITTAEHRNDMMQYILRLRLRHELSDLKNLDQKGIGFELKLPEKSKFQSKDNKEKHPK